MKKVFSLMFAVVAMVMVSCGSKTEAAPEITGTPYDGAKFTMTVPEGLDIIFNSEDGLNAAKDGVQLDATFSDSPCKPADFEAFVTNMSGILNNAGAKEIGKPEIEDNILTFKATYDDKIEEHFVVFLDDAAGVAGKVKYPVDKAAEFEGYAKGVAKTIAKK